MPTYTYKKSKGEPGFGKLIAFVIGFYLTCGALFIGCIVGLLFLIKALFF